MWLGHGPKRRSRCWQTRQTRRTLGNSGPAATYIPGGVVERAEQVAQIKLLMSRLDAGMTVDAGGFRRNPTTVYADPDLAEREWQTFFRGHPHLVGLSLIHI